MNVESYIEGLKAELRGALHSGDKDHEKAVKAELARVGKPEKETTSKPAPSETA